MLKKLLLLTRQKIAVTGATLVSINDVSVGDKASTVKAFTEEDVQLFAQLTRDLNPFHFDEAFCRSTPFGKKIVHGMLVAGLISGVLGSFLLPGGLYVKQTLEFKHPVFIGDVVEAAVVIREIDYEKNRVVMETTCTVVSSGTPYVVISGYAIGSPYIRKETYYEDSRNYSSPTGKH